MLGGAAPPRTPLSTPLLELGRAAPLSPFLFNIYVRELGMVISNCVHGVKYAVVGKDGLMEWKSQ